MATCHNVQKNAEEITFNPHYTKWLIRLRPFQSCDFLSEPSSPLSTFMLRDEMALGVLRKTLQIILLFAT